MRNAYGGNCYRCGLWVAPGTGYFEKVRGGPGFRVQHCYQTHNGGVRCEDAKARDRKAGLLPPRRPKPAEARQ